MLAVSRMARRHRQALQSAHAARRGHFHVAGLPPSHTAGLWRPPALPLWLQARDEAREDSDVDILVDFEVGPTFDSFFGLEFFLEDNLGRKVDLVTPDALKPRMRPVVEREVVDVA
jgi:hypothetical protein